MMEQINKEMAYAAEELDLPLEDIENKFTDICQQNSLNPETDGKLALSLFRQWFSGKRVFKDAPSDGGGLIKKANGFFIAVEASRNDGERRSEYVKKEYQTDPTETFRLGRVAIATPNTEGQGWLVKRRLSDEDQTTVLEELPENRFEVDTNKYIIPLDNIPQFGERKNPNYGRPLPASLHRMSGIFLGAVNDGEPQLWFFSYKGEASKTFTPRTFRALTMEVIPNSDGSNNIYGVKEQTADTLEYDADDTQPTIPQMQNWLSKHCGNNYTPLINLDRYHIELQDSEKTWNEKFVVTDGSVSSITMTPTKLGTRRMTISDLNSDFDYGGTTSAGTTCWVPPHIDIDFGITSNIVVIGKTSQGRNQDGSFADVTLNVTGLLVVDNNGVVVEPFVAEEEDLDWF
jgi:hypothetical protein